MDRVAELRVLYEAGAYDQAWAFYREHRGRGCEWHLLGARAGTKLRQHLAVLDILNRKMFDQAPATLRAQAHFLRGIASLETGTPGRAIGHFRASTEAQERSPEMRYLLRGASLYNIALAFHWQGQFTEALPAYEEALAVYLEENSLEDQRDCLQNMAWAAIEAGNLDRSADLIDQAAPLCLTAESRLTQRLLNNFLAARSGDYDTAMKGCLTLGETEGMTDRLHALNALIGADACLQSGAIKQAEETVTYALEYAVPLGDNLIYATAKGLLERLREAKAKGA